MAEGARYNLIGEFRRTINLPLIALRFLRGRDQHRSSFRIAGRRGNLVELGFSETAEGRLIYAPDNAAARGAFLVEERTGRLHEAAVSIRSRTVTGSVKTTFERDARLDLWLPRKIEDKYTGHVDGFGSLNGVAEHSNYRQFKVETSTEIGK